MIKLLSKGAALAALSLGLGSAQAQPIGQWDFNNGTLAGAVGGALDYTDGVGGATQLATQFGTTTALGIPDINGTPANVMKFPAAVYPMGYNMPVNANANGGGSLVNDWTLIMDVLYPAESHGKWRAFIETDLRTIEEDAELFVNTGNGIGIGGQYQGQILSNTWYRVAFAVSGEAQLIRKYINGVEVGRQSGPTLDGRFALTPLYYAEIFSDNDGDVAPGYVNSIQLWDRALSAGEVLSLGGPSAAGIPQTINAVPSVVETVTPAAGSLTASPVARIEALINKGETAIAASSVKLALDGADVAATVTESGQTLTASFQVTTPMAPRSVHTASVRYVDSVAGAKTNTWSFTVSDYSSITLPAPLFVEGFEAVEEGALPAGWTVTNATDVLNAGAFDVLDKSSDSYLDFVVISRETLASTFGANRRETQPVVVNGVFLESLIAGEKFIYANSDGRSGSQVQTLFSPDYNLTGKSNVFLSFYSMYAQNQDNIGAVEYSVDGGATWLPALYLLPEADIVRAGETIDAMATLNTARTDQALGLAYGAFIGATVSPSLAPFISPRVDDNQVESKRVEVLRLTGADNQARVRLRFAHAGTDSWYWGLDNIGIYSIEQALPPTITTPPASIVVSAGGEVTLSVVAGGTGPFTYQWKKGSENVANGNEAALVLRNVTAASAGDYTVVVSNAGGSVTSAPAKVEVFSGEITQDLVVHLKFENNLTDSSSRGNNGEAVGGPSFAAGKIGSAVHIPSGGDYVTLGDPADLDFGSTTDFSISLWAKITEMNGDPSLIGNKNWNSGSNQGYVIATDDDGHLQWNFAGPPGVRKDYDGPPGVFSEPVWRHIVVTYDRDGNALTYVDGARVSANPLTASQNDVSTPSDMATNIGQDGTGAYGSSFTDADFDDVGIWRRVLTVNEVAAIFKAGNEGKDLSTVKVTGGSGTGDPISMTVASSGNNIITLSWTGGNPPFAVQRKNSLSDAAWVNVLVTPNRSATVLNASSQAFFRVAGGSAATVTRYTATLNGANERPTPVTTPGIGVGEMTLEGDDLSFIITYTGLTGPATAAHIHGPASVSEAAGVLINLAPFNGGSFGSSGFFAGKVTLTADQKTALTQGRTYVNIHTALNGPGEIRGQIVTP